MSKNQANLRRVLFFIAGISVLTSFLFFEHFRDFLTRDSASYLVPAANMLMGRGFTNDLGYPETERTPAYSLVILPFLWAHLDLKYLILFQHILRGLIVLATVIFAYQTTESRRVTLVTGVLLCLDLPFLEAANTVMTEVCFTAVFLVSLRLLWGETGQFEKPRVSCFASGFLAGASVLIRPLSIFFFIPAIAYLYLARSSFKLRAAASFSFAFILLPFAWGVRNYRRAGDFTVTTISSTNLLLYRAAGALAIEDPGDFGVNLEKRQEQLQTQACADIREIYRLDCSKVTVLQRSSYYSNLGRSILFNHPLAYGKLFLRGEALMVFGGGLVKFREITGTSPRRGGELLLVYTVPVFCLAVLGFWELWNLNRRLFILVFLTILYFLTISSGAEAYSRFRVPIIPCYGFAAAMGLETVIKQFMAKNTGMPFVRFKSKRSFADSRK